MLTFDQFLESAAGKREFVNVMFEQRVFELIGTLQTLAEPLETAALPHELVGGLAVFLHVENADSTHSSLTRDIDLMIRREDLASVTAVAEKHGFRFRHPEVGESPSARHAIRLSYAGENANPPIRPIRLNLHGRQFSVIPLADLVAMKLGSYRDKDRVHIRGMDAAGLITPQVEAALTPELQARLLHTRATE